MQINRKGKQYHYADGYLLYISLQVVLPVGKFLILWPSPEHEAPQWLIRLVIRHLCLPMYLNSTEAVCGDWSDYVRALGDFFQVINGGPLCPWAGLSVISMA